MVVIGRALQDHLVFLATKVTIPSFGIDSVCKKKNLNEFLQNYARFELFLEQFFLKLKKKN